MPKMATIHHQPVDGIFPPKNHPARDKGDPPFSELETPPLVVIDSHGVPAISAGKMRQRGSPWLLVHKPHEL